MTSSSIQKHMLRDRSCLISFFWTNYKKEMLIFSPTNGIGMLRNDPSQEDFGECSGKIAGENIVHLKHSFMDAFNHSLTQLITESLFGQFIQSIIHSLMHTHAQSFPRLFVRFKWLLLLLLFRMSLKLS
jgi:hypothetical protein